MSIEQIITGPVRRDDRDAFEAATVNEELDLTVTTEGLYASHKTQDKFREFLKVHRGPGITSLYGNTRLNFSWSWPGVGFGQCAVYLDNDRKLMCMNECMSRESIRTLLVAAANKIADDMKLEDERG